jgi:hypothetical protein
MSQRQKVELTLNIGDEPAALRFGPDSTAIVVDGAVITLEGTLQQRQALVMSMARALGMMFVVQADEPILPETDPSPAEIERKREAERIFASLTTSE